MDVPCRSPSRALWLEDEHARLSAQVASSPNQVRRAAAKLSSGSGCPAISLSAQKQHLRIQEHRQGHERISTLPGFRWRDVAFAGVIRSHSSAEDTPPNTPELITLRRALRLQTEPAYCELDGSYKTGRLHISIRRSRHARALIAGMSAILASDQLNNRRGCTSSVCSGSNVSHP
jgi:hypothetical protein